MSKMAAIIAAVVLMVDPAYAQPELAAGAAIACLRPTPIFVVSHGSEAYPICDLRNLPRKGFEPIHVYQVACGSDSRELYLDLGFCARRRRR